MRQLRGPVKHRRRVLGDCVAANFFASIGSFKVSPNRLRKDNHILLNADVLPQLFVAVREAFGAVFYLVTGVGEDLRVGYISWV